MVAGAELEELSPAADEHGGTRGWRLQMLTTVYKNSHRGHENTLGDDEGDSQ